MQKFITKRSALIVISILFFLIAWNREINLLYVMFSLISATLMLSLILPRYSINEVKAFRLLPATAFEGDEITINVNVENNKWRSRYMLEIIDHIPAADPDQANLMTFIGKLPGRKKRAYAFNIVCYKRGDYSAGPLKLRSAYPLGISAAETLAQKELISLLVYPQVFEISHLPILSGNTMLTSGLDALSKTGGSEDFLGTREYREGDSLKYIHWPSSAKHSELIVKEFEVRASTELTIILDLNRSSEFGQGKDSTLEYAVKIAASITQYALKRGHSVKLIGYGKTSRSYSYSRGLSHIGRIFEVLARVNADGNAPYSTAISRASDYIRDGSTTVLFFSDWDTRLNEYLYSLELLRAKRVMPFCIFFDKHSFLDDNKATPQEGHILIQEAMSMGAPVYCVSKGDNLQEIFSA